MGTYGPNIPEASKCSGERRAISAENPDNTYWQGAARQAEDALLDFYDVQAGPIVPVTEAAPAPVMLWAEASVETA